MHHRLGPSAALLAALLGLGGCSFISPDATAEALRSNADRRVSFRVPVSPANACPKAARMLMWCAGGPSFHYRCNISPDGGKAELTGVLEAVYRTEFFMVTDFVRDSGGSVATVHQRDGVLIYDYAARIERYLTNPDCQPR
ncbi:hypothetical protein [Magnetospirillum sp. SS-4]|uniref:hypothetical protein n=1 Tax=Magnetospirillum sp. SS-4 TaxID=2681465 RepID=UPI00138036C8|nr:hypothetical protein [Magnetospirillum sp. SS-4]CAA7619348.1 conserved exported hypothetical protein [Magnetospirillum sp. SS-4]